MIVSKNEILSSSEDKKIEVLYNSGISTIKAEEIQGIPLTKEILLKCGFKQVGFYENVFEKENIRIHIDKNGKTDTILYIMYSNDDSIFKKKISSFHQLQNLFFTLTEEELEFKI